MFFYRITIRRPGASLLSRPTYHEFLRPRDVGEYVAGRFADGTGEIRVKAISQADYVRFTRPGA